MAEKPTNEKLYAMVVSQARNKYYTYPSPGASRWVHQRYIELGGRFQDTEVAARKEQVKRAWKKRLEEKRSRHGKHEDKHKGK